MNKLVLSFLFLINTITLSFAHTLTCDELKEELVAMSSQDEKNFGVVLAEIEYKNNKMKLDSNSMAYIFNDIEGQLEVISYGSFIPFGPISIWNKSDDLYEEINYVCSEEDIGAQKVLHIFMELGTLTKIQVSKKDQYLEVTQLGNKDPSFLLLGKNEIMRRLEDKQFRSSDLFINDTQNAPLIIVIPNIPKK